MSNENHQYPFTKTPMGLFGGPGYNYDDGNGTPSTPPGKPPPPPSEEE